MGFKSITLVASTLVLSTSTNAALIERLGGLAYYDDVANLTWLANANAAGTAMNWVDASVWVAGLDVAGVTGWRLPNTIDVGNDGSTYTNIYQGVDSGYNITTHSELSNMFYNVLGNLAQYDTSGVERPDYDGIIDNTGPFSNIQSWSYWSATEYAPYTSLLAWSFDMGYGNQGREAKSEPIFAWAVQSGDVSAVPIPSAVWLFGSGLIGLVGLARRKKA